MKTIADQIKLFAAELSTPKEEQALKTVLNTPGWEDAVKEFFRTHPQGAPAGREADWKTNLTMALLLLSQAAGATQAPQLIDFIKDQAKQEHVMPQQEQAKPTKADLDGVREAIPFEFGTAEEVFLSAPIINKDMSFNIFKHQLEKKIKNGLNSSVKPYIEKNPRLNGMDKDSLADVVTQEFINKIHEKKTESAMLQAFLEKVDHNMDDVARAANNAMKIELAMKA